MTDIILHILEVLFAGGGLVVALRGYFPKSTATQIEVLKTDLKYHKEGLDRLEKKIDKINDYLMEDL
jgi:hypothetical protein